MRIICFGDSNTYGYDPRDPLGGRYDAKNRWVEILAAQTGWQVRNRGENGRQIPHRLGTVEQAVRMLRANGHVDALVVMLGTNDILQGASAEDAAERMDAFLEQVLPLCGRVLLVVNVASKCGFTPQYSGLEELYRALRDDGLTVLGFPCDQFGRQEPGNEAEILDFCTTQYDITFPLFAKIDVNGANADPLYRWLKGEKPGVFGTEGIKWNFTKFLVGRDGQVIKRYAPTDTPAGLKDDIVRALAAPAA